MTHRTVGEVMTADVTCAREGTPFKELAGLMASREVSALPVLDEAGHVAGVVSEADLLVKEESQQDPTAHRLGWWRRHAARAKATGRTARDVMSSPAVTIGPAASVVEAARTLDRHHVKRLPVVDEQGHLSGIVSRRDLLGVFLRPDEQIAGEITGDVLETVLGTNPAMVDVSVRDGVVTLAGEVERKSMVGPAGRMAHTVDGVVDVVNLLAFAIDDTAPPGTGERPDDASLYLGPGGAARWSP